MLRNGNQHIGFQIEQQIGLFFNQGSTTSGDDRFSIAVLPANAGFAKQVLVKAKSYDTPKRVRPDAAFHTALRRVCVLTNRCAANVTADGNRYADFFAAVCAETDNGQIIVDDRGASTQRARGWKRKITNRACRCFYSVEQSHFHLRIVTREHMPVA